MMDNEQAKAEEEKRVRRLQRTVDLALFYINAAPLTREQAEHLVSLVRNQALRLFPDKADTYDLIYQPRFNRLLAERFGLH